MKKISFWALIFAFAVSLAQAQESATQQQIDKLSGQIQDILDAQAQEGKRLDAIEKEISDLRDKVNAPAAIPDSASRDDLKKLADQVQEIDRKRQEDRELILKQIEALANAPSGTGSTGGHHHSHPSSSDSTSTTTSNTGDQTQTQTPNVPQKGYEYEIKSGDTLAVIIKAYRDQGVKVSLRQIKAANPNMNPDVLIPGKKIFIPDPNAK